MAGEVVVEPYRAEYRTEIVELSRRAWSPVLRELERVVPAFVYESFYPNGWWERQRADVEAILTDEPAAVMVARDPGTGAVVGWVSTRLHREDSMGEVYILAVDPDRQRQGVARRLLDAAHETMRRAGVTMAMVETGDDPGHAGSRAAYESAGYQRWPVARYFLDLDQ
ncbi:MAG: GNAT family N-acetyltransferase [Dietzia sp.]